MHSKDKKNIALELQISLCSGHAVVWAQAGPSPRAHTETSTTPRRLPNTTVLYTEYSCSRGTGNGCIVPRAYDSPSPPLSISLLPVLQINSACRNNCVQYHDRLGKGCYFHFLYVKSLEKENICS